MAEKRSVYLSDRALTLPRRVDSLSARLNTVADRYAEALQQETERLRERFHPDTWRALALAVGPWCLQQPAAAIVGALHLEARARLPAELGAAAAVAVQALRPADRLLLAELLEAEIIDHPPDPPAA
jgi:hypothetical protein